MIKDILVHLDGTAQDEERLSYAEALTSLMQGHLTALFTNPLPDMTGLVPMDGAAAAAEVLITLEDEAKRTGDALQRSLAERLTRLSVPSEIRRIEATPGQLPARAASEARWADLFVTGRPYEETDTLSWASLFEAVLFESGRGVLVVPPGCRVPDAFRRILVCWRDTRETARAVAEAAPLIAAAGRTTVLMIDPVLRSAEGWSAPEADIAKHLGRLGTAVEAVVVQSEGRDVSDVILDQARRMSADLIVMGGYGHSRAREWMLGGATREMLTDSEFPILMAH